nr:protein translocase subunit SECA, chloroplastic [Tanacetum cinerariifolium]
MSPLDTLSKAKENGGANVVKPSKGVFVSVTPPKKTWKMSESLFPCTLYQESTAVVEEVVNLAGPAQDEVIAKLRDVFLKIAKEYRAYTEEEKKKVVVAGGLHVVATECHESRELTTR